MNRITWTTFFTFLFLIVIAYYIVVLLYYRRTINLSLFNKFLRLPAGSKASTKEATNIKTLYAPVTRLIQDAAKDGYIKEEILFALKKFLHAAGDTHLNETVYRTALNRHITDACQQYCSIQLSEEDLRVLWI